MNIEDLKKPFPAEDIEWRVQSCGVTAKGPWAMVLAYINARAVMDRLDEVVGPGNWQVNYTATGNGFLCNLGIRIEPRSPEWIWKSDGADQTDVEPFKGGISGALKRAANCWGIGRYLYNVTENFADCSLEKKSGYHKARTKDGKDIYWKEPSLPDWALPKKKKEIKKEETAPMSKLYVTAINSQTKLSELEEYVQKVKPDIAKLSDKEKNEISVAYTNKKNSLK